MMLTSQVLSLTSTAATRRLVPGSAGRAAQAGVVRDGARPSPAPVGTN